jgi:anti-sigma factor RsiW
MTPIEPRLLEQLSAWMDGELPADEARFLQRRLANDVALREQWERWQLAADCLKGNPVRLQDAALAGRIEAAIEPATGPQRRPVSGLRWLASAAAIALAAVLLPGVLSEAPAPDGVAASAAPAPTTLPAEAPALPALAAALEPVPPMSPLPSVRDFPLVDTGDKQWPRSPLIPEADARDGLLVRGQGGVPLRLPPPPDAGPARTTEGDRPR